MHLENVERVIYVIVMITTKLWPRKQTQGIQKMTAMQNLGRKMSDYRKTTYGTSD